MASTKNTVDEAAGLIRERIAELDQERAQLERALASLSSGGAPDAGRPGPRALRGPPEPSTAAAQAAPEPTRR